MNDITKLPRWAQHEIERLRADVLEANTKMANIVGATPTAVEVDANRKYRQASHPRMFLPQDYDVRFSIEGGVIETKIDGDAVRIMGHGDLTSGFIIVPDCSNVVYVRFERSAS